MKNSLGREISFDGSPFVSSSHYHSIPRKLIDKKKKSEEVRFYSSYEDFFFHNPIESNMTLSFHHHLRNGDYVLNQICDEITKMQVSNLHFAPSSIFPGYTKLVDLILSKKVTDIHTNYLNGEVANVIQQGKLEGKLVMNTHGGRARAIESGDLSIDIAFLATPTVDKKGNGTGDIGASACGSLGYAISDLEYAKKVVLVTDHIVENLEKYQLDGGYVDAVIVVQSIGDPKGIVSGTTKITRDPIGLKIAKDTTKLLTELGLIKNGFSMQTGAGGTSLAVVDYVKKVMKSNNVKGKFASGGITKPYVEMLEENMFEYLYDVQCFDLDAVTSFHDNQNHRSMSASKYGNPFEENPVVNELDFVILGATEIDTNFNVNVTTDSLGRIIGGSGGHSDTAHGAKVTIITSALIKSRVPIIKDEVITISTPGEDVDIFVCERGIAINPIRTDLINKLKDTKLKILSIQELKEISLSITGIPNKIPSSNKPVGYVEYRDGTIIDTLYQVR